MKRREFFGVGIGFSGLVKSDYFFNPPFAQKNLTENGFGNSILGLGTSNLYRLSAGGIESLLETAVELGIRYFDTAAEYGKGISEISLGNIFRYQRNQVVFTSKTLRRNQAAARMDLETSLQRLRTDYLDGWMIHDLRNEYEWKELMSSNGAIHAMMEAKNQGLAHWIGFSAHRNPVLALRALSEAPFDFVMIPVGIEADPNRHFVNRVLPEALQRRISVIGMKIFNSTVRTANTTEPIQKSLDYTLNLPLSGMVMGCEIPRQLIQNVEMVHQLKNRNSSWI